MTDERNMHAPTTDEAPAPRLCAACGQSFGCGTALSSCWCAHVSLDARTAGRLRESYDGCLCPACLERAAREGANEAAATASESVTP